MLSFQEDDGGVVSEVGGGLFLATYQGLILLTSGQEFVKANVLFNHLKLSHNKAFSGGGLAAESVRQWSCDTCYQQLCSL